MSSILIIQWRNQFFKAMIVYCNSRTWYYDKLTNEYICLRIVKKNLKFRKFIAEIHEE